MTEQADDQSIPELKADLRKEGFAQRKVARSTDHDVAANRHMYDHLQQLTPSVVSAYMAIRTEINPLSTMERLVAAGISVCVPVIIELGQPLQFHEWTPETVMIPGRFGAAVPKRGKELRPDVLITPLIVFDDAGNRLGYGGGFYDRTIALLRSSGSVRAIGFAYSGQQVAHVPTDATDVRLDAIVTEVGVTLI